MDDILIADVETDNLLKEMTKFWCVQLGNADTDEVTLYGDLPHCDRPLAEGIERLRRAKKTVFHNGFGFDFWAVNHFFPGTLQFDQVVDTLVLARMTNIAERNHSLDMWGRRLGVLKGSFKGPYDVWTQEFADYSRQDVVVGRALYHKVKHGLEWGRMTAPGEVYASEARSAYCIALQEQTGVAFDVKAAELLHAEFMQEKADIEAKLFAMFPAFSREEVFIPKVNNKTRGYVKGEPFIKKWEDPFNPRSRQMIAEALQRDGWVPQSFTKTGQPEVNEETILGANHPGARPLVRYLKLTKAIGAILGEKKGKGYLQLVKPDGRIYGRVNTLGCVTWRMSHSNPNTANIDKDPRIRGLFVAREGMVLAGCDGAEIQARWLAHYLARYDDGLYARKLLAGDKKLGTDGHSLNRDSLKPWGLADRDGAKTALYARIFGCREPRMFDTINGNRRDADLQAIPAELVFAERDQWKPFIAEAVPAILPILRRMYGEGKRKVDLIRLIGGGAIRSLGKSMPGLDELLKDVQAQGKAKGHLLGCDKAPIPCNALHSALVSLLQYGEQRAMKLAQGIIQFEIAPERGWQYGTDYAFVTNVHDEVQSEVRPDLAQEYGEFFNRAIALAGVRLETRCPLAGEFKIGRNWYETH
ncbi:DNA polymerase [Roseomonas sp. WA12]